MGITTRATVENREPESTEPTQAPIQPKRTLTPGNFLETVANFVSAVPVLVPALVSPKTSGALREKVFLGVTSVNDARYCKWAHTHWAMDQGVPLEEVNQILAHEIASLGTKNPAEAAAIVFGQHYAEHLDQIDPASLENLRKYYSEAQVDEVLAYVRFITFTNLLGNTADAFLHRFFVDMVGAATAPFALLLLLVAKLDRQVGIDDLSPWRRSRQDASPSPDSRPPGHRGRPGRRPTAEPDGRRRPRGEGIGPQPARRRRQSPTKRSTTGTR